MFWRELVRPQMQEKNQHYVQLCDLPGVQACGDADKVRQILLNLLSNAIKFTDVCGNIELNCEVKDGRICIRVVDDGSGIPRIRVRT